MSGGPLNESIILDFTAHMQKVLHIDAVHKKGRVLPGTYYRDFEKATKKHNLIMPSYTASKELCAVGGMVGNNSGGEKTLKYGKTEKYIDNLEVVFSDGNIRTVRPLPKAELALKMAQGDFEGKIYREVYELVTENEALLTKAKPNVSKNSAGYFLWNVWDGKTFDLTKLLVGSQGTLGLVTEITFKLVPVPKTSKLLVVFLRDLKPLGKLVNDILPEEPESLESYDNHTLKLAISYWRELFRAMKIKNIISLGISFLPELGMVLRGGLPKLVLLIEAAGHSEKEVDEKLERVYEKLEPYNLRMRITKTKSEAEKYWTIRRESFNLLRKHVHGKRTAPFIDDIIVRPEHLPEFLPKLEEILNRYKLLYTVAGHAGDGNFHIIPLMDMRDKKNAEMIPHISDEVYDLVLSYGGSITAEHNDGIIRTPYLEKMYGKEVTALFKKTKEIFDPQNIFNPGKKVGDTTGYMKAHFVRS
jgi:FAD/FMN-containing dehydrogenase